MHSRQLFTLEYAMACSFLVQCSWVGFGAPRKAVMKWPVANGTCKQEMEGMKDLLYVASSQLVHMTFRMIAAEKSPPVRKHSPNRFRRHLPILSAARHTHHLSIICNSTRGNSYCLHVLQYVSTPAGPTTSRNQLQQSVMKLHIFGGPPLDRSKPSQKDYSLPDMKLLDIFLVGLLPLVVSAEATGSVLPKPCVCYIQPLESLLASL